MKEKHSQYIIEDTEKKRIFNLNKTEIKNNFLNRKGIFIFSESLRYFKIAQIEI